MRIKAIVYDKVTVTCRSDPKKGGVYEEATVSIREEDSGGLSIRETNRSLREHPRAALYAKAKFIAHWWSSKATKNGKWKHSKLVPVEVTCEL